MRQLISTLAIVVSLTSATPQPARAGGSPGTEPGNPEKEKKRSGFVCIPAAFYTPETHFAGGAVAMFYFGADPENKEAKPSTITPAFIYTEKKQIAVFLEGNLYFQDEKYLAVPSVMFQKYPDKFWGIGPEAPEDNEEDYTPEMTAIFLNFLRRITTSSRIGIGYEFTTEDIIEKEEGGMLATAGLTGSAGGTASGIKLGLSWDSRDNIFYPTGGSYHLLSATWFGGTLGSDYDFTRIYADARSYRSLSSRVVLAGQIAYTGLSGAAPFRMLPQLGGPLILRGLYTGRYRDNHMAFAQVDLRVKLRWHFAAATFFGAGNVAPAATLFSGHNTRVTYGGGIRYFFNEDEGVSARIDFAGGGNSFGPYIYINEAF